MSRFRFDPDYLTAVAQLMREQGLGKAEMIDGERRLYLEAVGSVVVANPGGLPPITMAPMAAQAAPVAATPAAPEDESKLIRSPMVGTVYLAPSPDTHPFIKVGDAIEIGQTVMIVEAMKIMNQITAEQDGIVSSIEVTNNAPVEYGEILVKLR